MTLPPKWPLPSNRQHLSSVACLEDKREDNQNCSVLFCVRQLCTMIYTHVSSSYIFACLLGLDFVSVCLFRFCPLCDFFHASLGRFYSCIACFHYVGFSFFSTLPRDWLGRTSLKWLIWCRVMGRKTLTEPMNQKQNEPQRTQSITALCLEANDHPAEGRRLSWLRWHRVVQQWH